MTILNTIKDALTRTPPEAMLPPLLPPGPQDAASTINDAQHALRRAEKLCEVKTAELADARSSLARTEQAIGEKLADGEDPSASTKALQSAELLVKQLESALAVALQRKQDAELALKNAKRQASIDAEAEACARLNAHAPRGEALLESVTQFASEALRDAEALRLAGGNEKYAGAGGKIGEGLGFFLWLAVYHADPRHGNFPERLKPSASWSACLEKVCGMKARDEQR